MCLDHKPVKVTFPFKGFKGKKAEMEPIINRATSTALEEPVALNVGCKRKVVLVPLNDEPTAKLRPRRQSVGNAFTTVAPKPMPKRRHTNAFGSLIAQTQAEEPLFFGASTSGYQSSSQNRKTANDEHNQSKRVTRSSTRTCNPPTEKLLEEMTDTKMNTQRLTYMIGYLEANIKLQKRRIEEYAQEKQYLKSKQWCFWCQREATFVCCFGASYCSIACKESHFKNGHAKQCHNKEKAI